MPDNVGVKITQKQFQDLSKDFVLDLEALFNLMQEDILELIDKAEEEGWTPDQLIKEIIALI